MSDNAITQFDARQSFTATRAQNDMQLVESWLASMGSPISRSRFATTVQKFLESLDRRGLTLREMTVEDMRDALDDVTAGHARSTAQQYMARVKALISYGHKLGYLRFNAGAPIKIGKSNPGLAQRILTEVQVNLLIRAAPTARDRLLIEVAYFGGLRVSELTALTWRNVTDRGDGAAQVTVLGKGGKERQVMLPPAIGSKLLGSRSAASDGAPLFASRTGRHLLPREVNRMLKKAARRADVSDKVSAHWMRHAHASHALARGASLADVKDMLGHTNVATTSAYLHARPDRSSAYVLDAGIITRDEK